MNYYHSKSTGRFYFQASAPTRDARLLVAHRGYLFLEAQNRADECVAKGMSAKCWVVQPAAIEDAVKLAAPLSPEPARRARRNQLLAESDWSEMPKPRGHMGDAKAEEWDAYRQALRDLDLTAEEFEWPLSPEEKKL